MHHGRPVVPCRMRALVAVHVPAQHKVDLSLPKERFQMCGQIASRAWRASLACVLVPRRRGVQWAVHLNNQPGANKAAWRRIGLLHLIIQTYGALLDCENECEHDTVSLEGCAPARGASYAAATPGGTVLLS